ncbi:MAG: KPN_02809 family neutral zinc metallopeptidase [Acidimicrobiales bacterium]
MVRYDKSTAEAGRKYVRDRRRSTAGGGGRRTPGRGGIIAGGGIGAVIIALLVALLGGGGGDGSSFGLDATDTTLPSDVVTGGEAAVADPDGDTVLYLQALMFDIQDTWEIYFDEAGLNYEPTFLNVFEGSVQTGCGNATSAVGPFYCPAPNDMEVYIDLGFFDQLSSQFGAPGDFAQAYVVAHEVGHHLQSILGISDAVRSAQAQDPGNKNAYSIRQELQADCFAGVWAHSADNRVTRESGLPIIEPNDIEEGLAAAASVGDDRIQAQSGMSIDPHTWTHGSSDQRIRWFRVGYESGDPEQCDTFAATDL